VAAVSFENAVPESEVMKLSESRINYKLITRVR
jgi:hypothetical protein